MKTLTECNKNLIYWWIGKTIECDICGWKGQFEQYDIDQVKSQPKKAFKDSACWVCECGQGLTLDNPSDLLGRMRNESQLKNL